MAVVCRKLGHWDNSTVWEGKRRCQLNIQALDHQSMTGGSVYPHHWMITSGQRGSSPAALVLAAKGWWMCKQQGWKILLSSSLIWTIHDGLHSIFQLQICLLFSSGWLAKSILLLEQVRVDWDSHYSQRADFVQFAFHLWQIFLHATLQNNCCGICEQPGAFRYPNLLYG